MYQPQCVEDSPTVTPTVAHFLKTVSDQMQNLQLLSLLLTGDHVKAEQCFIAAIGEYAERDGTFIEWSRSCARTAIYERAIQMIQPSPNRTDGLGYPSRNDIAGLAKNSLFGAILSLGGFERFVYVITALEGHSNSDCVALLRCTHRDVLIARALACTRLAQSDYDFDWAVGIFSPDQSLGMPYR